MEKTRSHLHLLCIGVENSLIAKLLSKPEADKLSLDICLDLEDAKEKLASNLYKAYIFQHEVSNTAIEEIRQKNPKALIALIIDHPKESDPQKASQKIDYLIEKARFSQDVDILFAKIFEIREPIPLENKLLKLKHKYDESLEQKISHLEQLARSAEQNPELIKDLKFEIHKIAGSAGSFGYGSVSNLCKAMELEIHNRLNAQTHNDAQWLASLKGFIDRVKEGFKTCSFDEPVNVPLKTSLATKPLLYIIDDDVHFLELLERIKEPFLIDLIVEFDPHKALEQIQSSQLNPQGIVSAQTFRSSSISGADIIQAASKKNPLSPPTCALLLDKDTLEQRIEAMQKGANYVFCKPVSAPVLLKSMSEVMEANPIKPLKVLIVDDDKDFCDYVKAVLAQIGMSTKAIHDPKDLFKVLEEFKPNILLLDIILPAYDGLKLLMTIRQDISLKNLIIIMVTGSEKLDTRINAYAANVDDILFKPIDKNILQKRILNIAERRTALNEPSDNYTGLLQLKELLDELNISLEKDNTQDATLVLFEVNNFADWSRQHGSANTKDLLIYISNQLQWEADHKMKCFWYKASLFAVLFEKMDLESIEKKIVLFLSHMCQTKNQWHLSFNCSIVPISTNYATASKLLQAAEETLSEASRKEAQMVRIAKRVQKEEDNVRKEVMIVDPNQGLLKILKQAFESHGLAVNTYCEGGDALKEILNTADNRLPSLVISERKLPDMDGMDLCIKLKNRFRTPIPFFMLTVFAADKDISEGIRQGVEYIIKPFNISLLIQKALQTIFKS